MKSKVLYLTGNRQIENEENIIDETPLFFRVNEQDKILLRTPGADRELITGLLLTEGIISCLEDIIEEDFAKNKIKIKVKRFKKKGSFKDVSGLLDSIISPFINKKDLKISFNKIYDFLQLMEKKQLLRQVTKASHAAMLLNYSYKIISIFEDVGRHNALDKAIGKAMLLNKMEEICIGVLSSRISFEMVKKSVMAGIKILIGISRPTSLAIELAEKKGLTLVSLAKKDGLLVYTNKYRIVL